MYSQILKKHLFKLKGGKRRSGESYSQAIEFDRIAQNGTFTSFNALNQIVQTAYDPKGNLLQPGFAYDEQNRLIKANEREYVYDALGRRIQAGSIAYLYAGSDEIGAFEQGQPRELKITGAKDIAAIEIQGHPFAAVQDVQGTIRKLIDWPTGGICRTNNCDAFGMGLTDAIPYAYAGKRYDGDTGLVYFGQRYYDPLSARWISPDPLESVDHSNLYQYVFNNPARFQDPQGTSIGGYLFGIGEIILGGTIIAAGFTLEVVTVGGFTMGLGVTTGTGAALIGHGLSMTTYHAQDLKMPNVCWKNTNVYAPGRPLPLDPHGVPVPDTDAPHTQLGTKGSKRRPGESYPQAREFDGKGKPVKSIDFTDHGEPHIHPNPHEHPCKPNQTGGTPKKGGDPQPLENWKY